MIGTYDEVRTDKVQTSIEKESKGRNNERLRIRDQLGELYIVSYG